MKKQVVFAKGSEDQRERKIKDIDSYMNLSMLSKEDREAILTIRDLLVNSKYNKKDTIDFLLMLRWVNKEGFLKNYVELLNDKKTRNEYAEKLKDSLCNHIKEHNLILINKNTNLIAEQGNEFKALLEGKYFLYSRDIVKAIKVATDHFEKDAIAKHFIHCAKQHRYINVDEFLEYAKKVGDKNRLNHQIELTMQQLTNNKNILSNLDEGILTKMTEGVASLSNNKKLSLSHRNQLLKDHLTVINDILNIKSEKLLQNVHSFYEKKDTLATLRYHQHGENTSATLDHSDTPTVDAITLNNDDGGYTIDELDKIFEHSNLNTQDVQIVSKTVPSKDEEEFYLGNEPVLDYEKLGDKEGKKQQEEARAEEHLKREKENQIKKEQALQRKEISAELKKSRSKIQYGLSQSPPPKGTHQDTDMNNSRPGRKRS